MNAGGLTEGAGIPTSADFRALSKQIGTIHSQLRRDRWIIWGLAIAVAGLALALALVANQNSSRDAAQDAATARFALGNCAATNTSRAEDLAFEKQFIPWALPSTAAGRAETARLVTEVEAKDAARDCARLAAGS